MKRLKKFDMCEFLDEDFARTVKGKQVCWKYDGLVPSCKYLVCGEYVREERRFCDEILGLDREVVRYFSRCRK